MDAKIHTRDGRTLDAEFPYQLGAPENPMSAEQVREKFRENVVFLGPPGTAKSAIVQEMARRIEGRVFDYLLTRFTEPNEIFGPFDIRKLRDGELTTNTEGMLPEADFVFLDELLNANSAILNSLLLALNERLFRRGKESRRIKALTFVGASNHLPEDDALSAAGWLLPADEDPSARFLLKYVSLEAHTVCNQSCYFCPVSVAPRESYFMPTELYERIVGELIAQPLSSGNAALDVASAHLYEQSRRDAFRRLSARDALMVDAEPERLGIELVNRYHAVKRAGMI